MVPAAMVIGVLAGCELPLVTEERSLVVPHVAGDGLGVETGNGSVVVERGDVAEVAIEAELRGRDEGRLAEARVIAEREDGALRVYVAWPGGKARDGEGASFEITMRDADGIEVATGNGAVTIAGGFGGALSVTTGNGAVDVGAHAGGVDISAGNGDVVLAGVTGDVVVEAGNGSVRVIGLRGGVADLSSGNGSVELAVAHGFAGVVGGSTGNGAVSTSGVLDGRVMSSSRRAVLISFGVGGGESTLRSGNGNVRIRQLPEGADAAGSGR